MAPHGADGAGDVDQLVARVRFLDGVLGFEGEAAVGDVGGAFDVGGAQEGCESGGVPGAGAAVFVVYQTKSNPRSPAGSRRVGL